MTREIHHAPAAGIERMMKLAGKRRQRVAGILRQGRRRIELGVFQVGAAMTVPQTLQVRCATLE